jgi:hypothetical protein
MGSNITTFETLKYGRMIDSVISVYWITAWAWDLWFLNGLAATGPIFSAFCSPNFIVKLFVLPFFNLCLMPLFFLMSL